MDLGDGSTPIRRDHHERAWRVRGGPWKRERNGRELMLAVIRHLASVDVRGRQRFYGEPVDRWGEPLFSEPEGKGIDWRRVEADVDKVVNINRTHGGIETFLAQACTQCQTSAGASIRLGEDIELVLDLSRG